MKYRITVHPLYFCLCLYYVIIGKALIFAGFFLSVLLHEMAHAKVAYACGYRMERIVLMPYGAVLAGGENIERNHSLRIALAGPLCNGMLALATLALWWLLPDTYAYTESFFYANLSVAVFNLLPCFPLDGGRAMIALFKKKSATLKALRITGIIIGLCIIALGIVSVFYQFNITLIIAGAFLVVSAVSGSEREKYSHIASAMPFMKAYDNGVEERVLRVSGDITLLTLLEKIKPNTVITVKVQDTGKTFTEKDLQELFIGYPLRSKLIDIIENSEKYDKL